MVQRRKPPDTRQKIIDAATALIAERGAEAASNREVLTRAGVKAPTLYHHFGDKQGLLDAVVSDAFERYLAGKRALRPTGDPAVDIRRAWDSHVAFARAQPAIYRLMFTVGHQPSAAEEGTAMLRAGFDQLAAAGALRPGITAALAARALAAALHGVTASITQDPTNRSNLKLSGAVRDAVVAALLVVPSSSP